MGDVVELKPTREPLEVEPLFMQVPKLGFACSCGWRGTTDDHKALQIAHAGGTVNVECQKCGRPLQVRKRMVQLVTAMPKRVGP
jgi:hypothetical protein